MASADVPQIALPPEGPVIYPTGHTVGGTSTHPTIARRGSPEFFDTLANTVGSNSWSYSKMLPFLIALEKYAAFPDNSCIVSPERGCDGPMEILQLPPGASATDNNNLATIFQTTTTESPAPALLFGTADYNAGQNTYVSSHLGQNWFKFDITAPPDQQIIRVSTTNDVWPLITDANGNGINGRNIRLQTGAFVTRVLFKKKTAIGVEFYDQDGNVRRAFARKKVILCAGTLHSQSGIGDPAILAEAELPVLLANPNVGAHMRDQIYLHFAFKAAGDPTFSFDGTGRLNLQNTEFPYPAFVYASQDGLFLAASQIAYNFTPTTQTLSFAIPSFSEGSAHTATKNSAGQIRVDMPFFTDPKDLLYAEMGAKHFKDVIDNAASAYPAKGYAIVYPPASAFGGPDSDLDPFLKAEFRAALHNTGTCRMGHSISDSVVNSKLHVHGVKNLMVADLSVIPMVVDANTNDIALAIGEKAASIIKKGCQQVQ